MTKNTATVPSGWKEATLGTVEAECVRIEKSLQHTKGPNLDLAYVFEKFRLSIEYMATSGKPLNHRLCGAYTHYLEWVLWSFDYKNHLSDDCVHEWEFLQITFEYKVAPSLIDLLEHHGIYDSGDNKYLRNAILRDRNIFTETSGKSIPQYFHFPWQKARKLAQTIFSLYEELERKNAK